MKVLIHIYLTNFSMQLLIYYLQLNLLHVVYLCIQRFKAHIPNNHMLTATKIRR